MEYNVIVIKNSYPENEKGYTVYEVELDDKSYFAAKSKDGTWKVCNEQNVDIRSRNIPVWVDRRNCGIHLISVLDRMILAKQDRWQGPLPKILR